MIEAIFFDFNGVIIDDERIHLQAYRDVLKAEDVELTDEDYFASLGMDDVAFTRAAFARAGREVDPAKAREIIDREHRTHRSLIEENLPLAPGVVTFVKEAQRRYDLGIVSMAERQEIDHVLDRGGMSQLFSVIVSAGPSLKHKPAPDCYQCALDQLNGRRGAERKRSVLSSECLVIEDSPPGIEAARGAGMRTLAVTNTVSQAALRAAGAEIISAGLADWNVDAVRLLYDR
jgi:HAD superfamily hydrolase (TIGR01509 family)